MEATFRIRRKIQQRRDERGKGEREIENVIPVMNIYTAIPKKYVCVVDDVSHAQKPTKHK